SSDLKETLGAGSLAVRADVSNLTDLDTMFATIKREFGHLDGIFVNAGYSDFRLFEEVTEQSFDRVIAVDFKGVYFTIQKALPLLRKGSSVIITSSVGARKGWPTTSAVSSCKAAVSHLARILSAELVDRGIRVNTLSPGPTDTAMFGRFPGEEQGRCGQGVAADKQSEQAAGRSGGNREAGSLPGVGRFRVRRRGRLPDRRRGHGHFGRRRLSHSESVGIVHPFRKLREAGPMTPAQVAVVLNRDVVMHTPLLIKPLVGRELVAIVIAMSTQSRDDPGAYVLEDYPPPMARHGRRTQARDPGAPDRRRERTAAGAHGRIPAVSGSQNIEKSADGSERRQAAGRLVGLSGGNRKVIRSATLAAAQFDVRAGDLHERKSLLPAP